MTQLKKIKAEVERRLKINQWDESGVLMWHFPKIRRFFPSSNRWKKNLWSWILNLSQEKCSSYMSFHHLKPKPLKITPISGRN